VFDTAARDIDSVGLALRSTLLEAASTIHATPAQAPATN
jgi:hypothetical protein